MTIAIGDIRAALLRRPSAALSLCAQPAIAASLLAERIGAANEQLGHRALCPEEISALAATDYRAIAREIHARHGGGDENRRLSGERPSPDFVSSFEELNCADTLVVLVLDHACERQISEFLAHCGNRPTAFIDAQFDIPGRNAVFRNGVVKSWQLPDGTRVVSKRDNRRKKNGLLAEQNNLRAILHRLGAQNEAEMRAGADGPIFAVGRPICVLRDPEPAAFHAIYREKLGRTLEEVLLDDTVDPGRRRRHLADYRLCLDMLFDKGIVWRDMSPRNILVEDGARLRYHLVDFEKVDFHEASLDIAHRVGACRTQFCVEELGVVCPEHELLETFAGLFQPDLWDVESPSPLPFAPRTEMAAILAGREIRNVSVGTFNKIDREVFEIRRPRIDPASGAVLRPGMLGFRVEHYLSLSDDLDSAEYDRRTTEVLIAARARGKLVEELQYLSTFTDELETAVILAEFDAIRECGRGTSITYPHAEARRLCAAIDSRLEPSIAVAISRSTPPEAPRNAIR